MSSPSKPICSRTVAYCPKLHALEYLQNKFWTMLVACCPKAGDDPSATPVDLWRVQPFFIFAHRFSPFFAVFDL